MIFRSCQLAAALVLRRLAGCLARLTGEPDLAEIIVVDDESTDRTAAVGDEHGAAVLAGPALPLGWAGKA